MQEYACVTCGKTTFQPWMVVHFDPRFEENVERVYCSPRCVASGAVDFMVRQHDDEVAYFRNVQDRQDITIKRLRAELPRRKRWVA